MRPPSLLSYPILPDMGQDAHAADVASKLKRISGPLTGQRPFTMVSAAPSNLLPRDCSEFFVAFAGSRNPDSSEKKDTEARETLNEVNALSLLSFCFHTAGKEELEISKVDARALSSYPRTPTAVSTGLEDCRSWRQDWVGHGLLCAPALGEGDQSRVCEYIYMVRFGVTLLRCEP